MSRTHIRVLALDPTPHGFAYAVLEGNEFLVESELARVKNDGAKERFDSLVLRYLPDVVVLETPNQGRRGITAQQIIKRLASRARRLDLTVAFVSRAEVKKHFGASGKNKYLIAREIGKRFPELLARVPKQRRAWDSEAARMSIFDAISFALTALARDSEDIEF